MSTVLTEQQNDLRTAVSDLMAKRSPEDFDLLFMQAQVSYRAKQLEQARDFLDQYVTVQAQRLKASAAAGATDAPAALAEAYQLMSKIAEEQGQLDEAVSSSEHVIDWRWVKGHAGDPGNERADALANQGVEKALAGV